MTISVFLEKNEHVSDTYKFLAIIIGQFKIPVVKMNSRNMWITRMDDGADAYRKERQFLVFS